MSNSPTSPTCGWTLLPEFRMIKRQPGMTRALRTHNLECDWEWKQRDNSASELKDMETHEGWTATSVPTEIFKDLLEAGKIPDPHLDQNEKKVQWVGEVDWMYRTKFAVDCTSDEKVVLVFDGLDTFATIYLNGTQILKSENMFHEHRVDVRDNLRPGSNVLAIVFESALKKGRQEVAKRGHLACWNGEPSRLYVRKAQYHWGWDWGPVMMSAGPWKPIRLEIYESRIDEIHFAVTVSEDLTSASVNYNITIESATSDAMVRVTLYKPQGKKTINDKTTSLYSTTVPIENGVVKGTFKIDKPELWYPIHYGTQALYTIIVDLFDDDTLVDTKHQKLAFRRARVVQQKLKDTKGTSFYFEINNIPIFCSGSNWIPADTMLTRLTCKRYREWLTLVIRGNQNMIRVWGGGIYEHDCFYDIADELGILIWQDFQFACGQYPCHSTFLENVERETITQIKRLRRHPSVVLFAGNNEDYQLAEMTPLEYDPMDLNPEHWLTTTFPARYIYEKILPELVAKHAPGVFYHPGSPWGNGKPTTDPTVGDIHQWNVWHGSQKPYQSYPFLSGRFISEFGMQALPSPRTISHFITENSEYYPQSQTMDSHNKATGFERRLGSYVLENIRMKTLSMEEFAIQSQRMQADALALAYRSWRREWKGRGREYVGGALVWQLNDCWPCTSWAIVDYFLRPKLAWYAIRRELQRVTIGISRRVTTWTMIPEDTEGITQRDDESVLIDVWGVSACVDPVDAAWTVDVFDIATGEKVLDESGQITLRQNQSTRIPSKLDISMHNPANVVISATLKLFSGEIIRAAADWPQPLKYIPFLDRGVKYSVDGERIVLLADKPTKAIVLDVEGNDDSALEWSDNGFDIMPGEVVTVNVKFLNRRKVTVNWYGDN